jgi:hypothetical protein
MKNKEGTYMAEKEKKEKKPVKEGPDFAGVKKNGSAYYVKCVKCNGDKYTRLDVLQKRIEKAGSVGKMTGSYVCRDCKKDTK